MELQFRWETHLLPLALKASERQEHWACSATPLTDQGYQYCDEVTKINSKTFHLASSLLPPEKRTAARALYAFCRITDDIVDQGGTNPLAKLSAWQRTIQNPEFGAQNQNSDQLTLVALAWCQTRQRFAIPSLYAEQLICGVIQDLTTKRYANFSDLAAYCYGVACTVGLMSMHIVGYSSNEAIPYAIRLGVALQLTNILRDVGEDWRMGRLYLPQDELKDFGLVEENIERGIVTDAWRAFMRFQINRARQLYASALPGIDLLHADGRFAIRAAAELYQAILDQIEKNDYNVFSRRAVVSKADKLRRLPIIWRKTRSTNTL